MNLALINRVAGLYARILTEVVSTDRTQVCTQSVLNGVLISLVTPRLSIFPRNACIFLSTIERFSVACHKTKTR